MKTNAAVSQRFSPLSPRHTVALSLWLVTLVSFWRPLASLFYVSMADPRSSHIALIPIISGLLIWLRRAAIFSGASYSPAIGVPLVLLGFSLRFTLNPLLSSLSDADKLSAAAALIVLTWLGVFITCYGTASFRAAVFPLLFLLLMIPIPSAALDYAVVALQKGSAEVSYYLFRIIGVPVARQGFRFSLPGVDIEIAEQCSSIRSSLSLFIVGLLSSHVLLKSFWKKATLTLLTIPIAIFKNAVRIVTISWLGIYWDPDFFHGSLHMFGGLPFSLIGFALLGMFLFLFRRPLFSPSKINMR